EQIERDRARVDALEDPVVEIGADESGGGVATQGELAAVLYNALEACRIAALLLCPLMPVTSDELFARLSLEPATSVRDGEAAAQWGGLPVGNLVTKGDALFPRL
ncbi:MAG: hypothetical protein IJG88_05325, partial [Eggerthellaceae bacterium]|nr:hypothetical protein [Eggerthellaceae bacterium]